MNAIVDDEVVALEEAQLDETDHIPLPEFISKFGAGLLQAVRAQNPLYLTKPTAPTGTGS